MLKSFCYRSSINNELSVLQTEALFSASKKNNDRFNIKGLLYKYNGYYFQIIEGETEAINGLIYKLKTDHRHHSLNILADKPISKLTFNSFTTGYNKVEDLNTLYGLQEYHDYIESNNPEANDIFSEIISNLFSLES
jgi:hypothetical protein